MGKTIEYKEGETLGPYGCSYMEDVEPKILKNNTSVRHAIFACSCGKLFKSSVANVKYGNTKSCGCRRQYWIKEGQKTHGLSNHPLFRPWCQIKERCYNERNTDYHLYGLRGIRMYNPWRDNFAAFLKYMMSLPNAMEDGYSVDRFPNNDGNYGPNNMRWATARQQRLNQRQRDNRSGYTGVYPKNSKFQSNIMVRGELIYLGVHDTPEKAALIRNEYIINNELWEYPIQDIKSTPSK